MEIAARLPYYRRVFRAYVLPGQSQLTFWHENPEVNFNASSRQLGEYYMPFFGKANYAGHHDHFGLPMLHYHGEIGLQYNPIAIAQWGLGNYNLFCRTGDPHRKQKFLNASNWLRDHLEQNSSGLWVWNHHFDWEYRQLLKAPWHSGLAQGQGISLLLRAYLESGDESYVQASAKAFEAFQHPLSEGGVTFTDDNGNLWFEEYIVSPPTHILNGFIWAAWGVLDYFLATGDKSAGQLFESATQTLAGNLHRYDFGFWSLYELSGTRLPMLASRFYHWLHTVQLRIMTRLTGEAIFGDYAEKWEGYTFHRANRTRALVYKSAFKLCYY